MEAAEAAAHSRGLTLSAAHWQVLFCAREECLSTRLRPDARVLSRKTGLSRAQIDLLFPGDSGEVIAEIAGLDLEHCGGDD